MPVDHACDDDRWERDTVSDLAQDGACVPERGRDGLGACEGVDDDADDNVERGVCNLQKVEGLWEVLYRKIEVRDL